MKPAALLIYLILFTAAGAATGTLIGQTLAVYLWGVRPAVLLTDVDLGPAPDWGGGFPMILTEARP